MFRQLSGLESQTLRDLQVLEEWLTRLSDPNREPWTREDCDQTELLPGAVVTDPTAEFNDLTDTVAPSDDDESGDNDEEEEEIDYVYKGKRDSKDRFDIFGTLTFDNGDVVSSEFKNGIRDGGAVVVSPRNNIARLCGTYVNGKMQGRAKLVSISYKQHT